MNKCETCDHKEVCGKKAEYKTAYDKVNQDIGEFEVELKCKYFKSNSLYNTMVTELKNYTLQQYPKPYVGDIIPNRKVVIAF